jgi:hypothetical protein
MAAAAAVLALVVASVVPLLRAIARIHAARTPIRTGAASTS